MNIFAPHGNTMLLVRMVAGGSIQIVALELYWTRLHLTPLLRHAIVEYGYIAVALALLVENAGLPVPGESVLLLASFVAYSQHTIRLPWLIVTGIVAATVGDNIGYAIGFRGGRRLLERYRDTFRISSATLQRGERIFASYGSATVLFARFVFGMRVIAGPLAGVLRMPWRRFFLFNFLGACIWVVVVAGVGFLFGRHWDRFARDLNWLSFSVVTLAIFSFLLWRWRNHRRARRAPEKTTA